MAGHLPPHRSDYECDAHWAEARHRWFKENRKPRKPVEPVIIRETVEVERIVYRDRPVPYQVSEAMAKMDDIRDRLEARPSREPSEAFKALMLPGEDVPAAKVRLSEKFDELQARVANGAATTEQQQEHTVLHGIYFELKGRV